MTLVRPSLSGDTGGAESGERGECDDPEFGDSGGVFAGVHDLRPITS